MARAQRRDAARSGKFYFRKEVYALGRAPTSSGSSSGGSTPCDGCNGIPRPKEKKMRNCFPPLPLPENGVNTGPVEDEYEEMSLEEIMNGKVRIRFCQNVLSLTPSQGGCCIPGSPFSRVRLFRYTRPRREINCRYREALGPCEKTI